MVSLSIVGAGFHYGTPELLWRPGPLIAGLQYELNHYSNGHIPHQAYDLGDNNLFYWTQYLAWLGLGLLPTLFALLFIVRIVRLRRWEDIMLGTFLAVSGLLTLASKVRFERNLEICLGPLALVAGVTAWDCICWMSRRQNVVRARFIGIAFVALWFSQPLRVLYNFRETVDYRRDWRARLEGLLLKDVPTIVVVLKIQSTDRVGGEGLSASASAGLWRPFSAEAVMRWNPIFSHGPHLVLKSPWHKHNYPFFHGE